MEDNELLKKPDMGIFDRQFLAIFDDPIYNSTKMTIITGSDGVLDDLFSYQVYNKIKNHWRAAVAPADIQAGMIWSDSDDDKLYHHGAADEEILQLTRSADVSPYFANLYIAEYIYHTGDLNTSIRFQEDQITFRAGAIDFINLVEAAPDYLTLLVGLNFIGDFINTEMTIGLTINQGANDDEIFARKSSDVAHGMTDETETDTYGLDRKQHATAGGLRIEGYSGDVIAHCIVGFATNDNTEKNANAVAPISLLAGKKSVAGVGAVGANGNLVVIYNQGVGTRWLVDEDGDTWQDGNITAVGELDSASLKRIISTPTGLTITAGGAITVTRSYHTVDGDGGVADNLDTINGGVDGMILILRAIDDATTITVRDGQGNIELQGGADLAMGTLRAKMYLFYDATEAKWVEIARFTG